MSTSLQPGLDMIDSQDASGKYLVQEYISHAKLKNQEERFIDYSWSNPGETEAHKKIAYIDYYEEWDWILVVGAYYDEFYQPLEFLKYVIAGVCIIFVLSGIIVFYLLSRRHIELIKQMQKVTSKISNGDLTVTPIEIKGNDELYSVAASVNSMAISLKSLIGKMSTTGKQVTLFANDFSVSIDESVKASNVITESITKVAEGAEKQSIGAQQSATAVEEISIGIQRIAETTSSVSESTSGTAKTASEGNDSIKQAVIQMNKIRKVVDESSFVIQKLGDRSKQIGDIISIITDISAQTNLLSLNAAIEAAKAGEHGKGFAVVASEVRKLAEQTTHSADNISELINEIQKDAGQSIQSMTTVTNEVSQGIDAVNIAGNTFEEIVIAAEQVAAQILEVSASVEQMSAGSEQVSASLSEMTTISSETTNNSQSVAASSEEQLATMQELQVVKGHLQQMANELEEAISKFKF
ncbi:methyl-accepting chemotaxis protein [Halalkalibacter urbisdiaboli]|uniref:methyl-accepting chemotaxis protein n=1 Tax=Halalkalibacter urbisdiaboli TaxID=1960589 RepID=UPI0024780CDC|nr:methyl-accepting chemotaxis protein [Halalkalibacter urbisdiaboli]